MQICCLWIFGKRRHSGEMSGKSQLKADIFYLFTPLTSQHCVSTKRSTNYAGKRLRTGRLQNNACNNKKVDQMVKIYISQQKTEG
jgi:hypothetical protein